MNNPNVPPPPSFFANRMCNINFSNDGDDEEEITRSVAFPPTINRITSTNISNTPKEREYTTNNILPSSSSSWNLTNAPIVPAFGHPLEPTSVLVPKATASSVAKRVSHIIDRLGTIEVEYNDNQAECKTCDNIEFDIFLYSDGGNGIIVEVQRIHGNSFSFYSTVTKTILGGVQQDLPDTTTRTVIVTPKNESPPADDEHYNTAVDIDEVSSLQFAMNILRQAESRQLGLELLGWMTDPNKLFGNSEKISQALVADKEALTLIFQVAKEEDLQMPSLMLLHNISNYAAAVPMEQQLAPFLRSREAQIVYLAVQCLKHNCFEMGEESRQHAEELGREKHHAKLYSLCH